MPIGISNVVAYRSIRPVWVILCSVITVQYSDVPTGTYYSTPRYPFPLEDAGIRLQLSKQIYIYIIKNNNE